MILNLLDLPIKAARIYIKKFVELMSIISKFLYFKFSAHLITNACPAEFSVKVRIEYLANWFPFPKASICC